MQVKRFKGKVVWITGASSGIGEALACKMAGEGAILVLSARRENELKRVEQNCKAAQTLILPFDLSDTSNAKDLAEQVIQKFGRIDILVNNGGISQRSTAAETPIEVDRKIMEVNFFATVSLTKAVLPYMLKQNAGHIVVISSVAGKFGFYLRSAYSASKHALYGFFDSLRLEIEKQNIKVTMICPGKVFTNISLHALTSDGNEHGKMDQSHQEGVSAEKCAEQITEGILKGKEEVLIGGKELIAVYLKRFLPFLFGKVIRKQNPF
jgi:short-subunit dehydrogenase